MLTPNPFSNSTREKLENEKKIIQKISNDVKADLVTARHRVKR